MLPCRHALYLVTSYFEYALSALEALLAKEEGLSQTESDVSGVGL